MKKLLTLLAAALMAIGVNAQTWNFSTWNVQEFTESTTLNGLTIAASSYAKVSIDENSKTVDGIVYTKRLKLGGYGTAEARFVSFEVMTNCTIEVVACSSSLSTDRNLCIAMGNFDNTVGTIDAPGESPAKSTYEYEGGPTTVFIYSPKGGVNIYSISINNITYDFSVFNYDSDSPLNEKFSYTAGEWGSIRNNEALETATAINSRLSEVLFNCTGSGNIVWQLYGSAGYGNQLLINNSNVSVKLTKVMAGDEIVFHATSNREAEFAGTTIAKNAEYAEYTVVAEADAPTISMPRGLTIRTITIIKEGTAGRGRTWDFTKIFASSTIGFEDNSGNMTGKYSDDPNAWAAFYNNVSFEGELMMNATDAFGPTKGLVFKADGTKWLYLRFYPEEYGGKHLCSNNRDLLISIPARAGKVVILKIGGKNGTISVLSGAVEESITCTENYHYQYYILNATADNVVLKLFKNCYIQKIYVGNAPSQVDPALTVAEKDLEITAGKTASIEYSSESDIIPTFTSSDETIATVDALGNVSALKAGVATITVAYSENPYYKAATQEVKITVNSNGSELPAEENNTMLIYNKEAKCGETISFPIELTNEDEITAFQLDLYLPEGVTIAKNSQGEELIELSDRSNYRKHQFAFNTQQDGAMRIVCSSESSAVFTGNDGVVMTISLTIGGGVDNGNYDIWVKNIELTGSNSTAYHPADIRSKLTVLFYTLGDVDNNGSITVTDAVCIVNHIINKTNAVFIEAAADLDGSGTITVTDKVVLINRYILNKPNAARSMSSNTKRKLTEESAYLSVNTINMKPGETRDVEINLTDNRGDLTAFQADILLPDGMNFVMDGGYYADQNTSRASYRSHELVGEIQSNGALRVVLSSSSSALITGTDGMIIKLKVAADANFTPGGYELKLENVELSNGTAIVLTDRTSILNVLPDLDEDVAQFAITSDIPEADVTLKRTIVADKYNTLAVPFDLTDAQVKTAFGSDAKVYSFSNVTDGEVVFTSSTAGISANVPVLLKTSTGGSSYDFKGVTLKPGSPVATGSYFDFVGNYGGSIALSEGVYFLNSDELYRAKDKSRLKGYRAFIQQTEAVGARTLSLVIDGNTTTIDSIEADKSEEAVYNLNGQNVGKLSPINGLKKGVYVSKGKKVVVR